MKIYISGQISDLPKHEAEFLFERAQMYLEGKGHEAVNPMNGETPGLTWGQYMAKDFLLIENCQAMYMLANWQQSRGARIERSVADMLGLQIFYEETFIPFAE